MQMLFVQLEELNRQGSARLPRTLRAGRCTMASVLPCWAVPCLQRSPQSHAEVSRFHIPSPASLKVLVRRRAGFLLLVLVVLVLASRSRRLRA